MTLSKYGWWTSPLQIYRWQNYNVGRCHLWDSVGIKPHSLCHKYFPSFWPTQPVLNNSEVWHIPTLNPNLKQNLPAAFQNGLGLCNNVNNPEYYNVDLHRINKQVTPNQISTYKHAALFLFWNFTIALKQPNLIFKQILTGRQLNFNFFHKAT